MDAVNNLRAALHPKLLELIILPTEKCNFRCTYCYETFEVGKMKRPTVEGIKNLITARVNRQSLEHLTFSWFGGEPMLALDLIYELSDHAQKFVDEGFLKTQIGNLTTNGYLLNEENLRGLVSRRQRSFQISLDGYGEGHDATRKYINGKKSTFEVIWKNLLNAHNTDLDFEITLRLHQTAENGESMNTLVSEICKNFGGDKRFSVFFKTIENLGGPNAHILEKMNLESAGARVSRLAAQLKEAGFLVSAVLDGPESNSGLEPSVPSKPLEPVAAETVPPGAPANKYSKGYSGYICYASKPNSLMIRANGGVGKCTVMLDDPRNDVGKIRPDGTVQLNQERMKPWMRGFQTFDALELGCPAQNLPKNADGIVEVPVEFPVKGKAATVRLADLEAVVA